MTRTEKIFAWIFGLGLLGFGIYKLTQTTLEIKAFYDQIMFSAENIKISKVDKKTSNVFMKIVNALMPTLRIRFDIKITNPTKTSVTFQKPFVKILYDGSVLATSTLSDSNNTIKINKENHTYIRDFEFDIDLLSNFTIVYDMISKVVSGMKIDRESNTKENVMQLASMLTDNVMTKLLPMFEVNILVYAYDTPIDVTFNLV